MAHRRRRNSQAFGPLVIILVLVGMIALLYSLFQRGGPSLVQQPALNLPTSPAIPLDPTGAGENQESIRVWFSDPLAKTTSGGPDSDLIAGINRAQKSVDMAIYNLTLPGIRDALLTARKRGVQVRLVMESEAMDKAIPRSIQAAGIPIVGDQHEGLMHNKFTIIDGEEVWTGSMNYTATSFYSDFNNLVRIRSAKIVSDYEANFEEMFTARKFGPDKQPNTPYPDVTVDGKPVEVYFSPDDGVAKNVLAELKQAQDSIDVLAYSFTRNDFADVIAAKVKSGVKFHGVFDADQAGSNIGGEYDFFRKSGYAVRLDGIPGLLHDKVMIIDRQVVITGSYNFTATAEKTNDENLVIIHDPVIAAQYLQHFNQVLNSSQK